MSLEFFLRFADSIDFLYYSVGLSHTPEWFWATTFSVFSGVTFGKYTATDHKKNLFPIPIIENVLYGFSMFKLNLYIS